MNPLYWPYRLSFLSGFAVCVGLLGFVLYTEVYWNLIPCPLCIFQRIGFMVMGLFFLLGGLHAPRGSARWLYTAGVLLGALFGLVMAVRHLWIQSLPPDQVPTCGPPLGYMWDTFPLAKVLKLVFTGSGECAKVEKILRLPMPAWSLIWFFLLGIWSLRATLRKRA